MEVETYQRLLPQTQKLIVNLGMCPSVVQTNGFLICIKLKPNQTKPPSLTTLNLCGINLKQDPGEPNLNLDL